MVLGVGMVFRAPADLEAQRRARAPAGAGQHCGQDRGPAGEGLVASDTGELGRGDLRDAVIMDLPFLYLFQHSCVLII